MKSDRRRQDLDAGCVARRGAMTTRTCGSTPPTRASFALVSDQGAAITVNGGETWSSWYNQPTAQLYHVSATPTFPYRICSGQQESGSVCIASRGNDGAITDPRLAPGGRDRVRLRGARPARSGRHLRRGPHRGVEIPLVHRTDPERHTGAGTRQGSTRRPHPAAHVLAPRRPRSLLRAQPPLQDERRRHDLEHDQSGPGARGRRAAGERRHAASQGRRRAARGDLCPRAFTAQQRHALGRHRRRPGVGDPRRRRALERRHAARSSRPGAR